MENIKYPAKEVVKAWLRLIRIPNLIILSLIYVMLHVGIYLPIFFSLGISSPLNGWVFSAFILSFLMVVAGGNIINDYFDYQIDLINRPSRLSIGKVITFDQAFMAYLVLTLTGVVGGFITGWFCGIYKVGFFYGFIALLLYLYSESFKKRLIIGNFIIAFCGSLSIVLLWLYEFFSLRNDAPSFILVYPQFSKINLLMGGYALFAFLTTMIREILKDIEDIEGDQRQGCNTLPIAYGVNISKRVVFVFVFLTTLILVFCQIICFTHQLKLIAIYIFPAIQLPLFVLIYRLIKANSKNDFHSISTFMKLIMVAGILGIQLINIHI
ncbi:MAG: geranylgeranylglycerol-phosphate geranylgeranyltransferase [Bacteroidetes bacterium]|nr:geranylgeranylglycerol-phosphate geranylgeranyltransferase [Bacteroidota bacterium]